MTGIRTLAIIKPDAIEHADFIVALARSEGFIIRAQLKTRLGQLDVDNLYRAHVERDFYPAMRDFMMSGDVMILALERINAVNRWRAIMGPTNPKLAPDDTLRGMFGDRRDAAPMFRNAVHGSDSDEAAEREIALFFGPAAAYGIFAPTSELVTPPTRVGDWMQTAHGRKFWPLDPRAEEVHLDDIAHALSMICRFGGHSKAFYSVAEHSVRVSRLAEQMALDVDYCDGGAFIHQCAIAGLMHDAAEAYIGDMIRPLKTHAAMAPYKAAEHAIELVIGAKFGFVVPYNKLIKNADDILCATEARDLMGGEDQWRCLRKPPLDDRIVPLNQHNAWNMFLNRAAELGLTEVSR